MESSEFLDKIHEVEKGAKSFEAALRTAFLKNTPNNHIPIQRVNRECDVLKQKVRELLAIKTAHTGELFKRDGVVTTAQWLIQKFEHVKDIWIPLTGDVFILYANAHLLKSQKNDKK